MKEFLATFLALLQNFKNDTNTAMNSLPPLEQFEVSDELNWAFQRFQWFVEDLKERSTVFETEMMSKFEAAEAQAAEAAENAVETARAKLIEDNEFISQADHEVALQAAVDKAKQDALDEIQAQQESEKQAAERQSKLSETLPEGVTVTFPSELLSLEQADFELASRKISDRLSKLSESGIQSAGAIREVCSLATDETGDTAFEAKLDTWKELSKTATVTQSAAKPFPKPSGSAPVTNPEEEEAELVMV